MEDDSGTSDAGDERVDEPTCGSVVPHGTKGAAHRSVFENDVVLKWTKGKKKKRGRKNSKDYVGSWKKGHATIGVVVSVPSTGDTDDEGGYESSEDETASSSTSSSRSVRSSGESSSDTSSSSSSTSIGLAADHIRVCWVDEPGEEVDVPRLEVQVIDRPLYLSEIVASVSDPVGRTGTVTKVTMNVDLLTSDGRILRGVPSDKILRISDYRVGQFVLSSGASPWLGIIHQIMDDVVVRLDNDSFCMIEFADLYCINPCDGDRYWTSGKDSPFFPGQKVTVDAAALASSRWIKGKMPEGVKDGEVECTVYRICERNLSLRWLMPVPGSGEDDVVDEINLPPATTVSPETVTTMPDDDHVTDWSIAEVCRFKKNFNPSFSPTYTNGHTDGKTGRKHKTRKDSDVGQQQTNGPSALENKEGTMTVLCTHTLCNVHWQDGDHTHSVPGCKLLALEHFDDSDLWPNDFVTKQGADSDADNKNHTDTRNVTNGNLVEEPSELSLVSSSAPSSSSTATRRQGVVQTVDFRARTAVVRWQASHTTPNDGFLLGDEEKVSLYELEKHLDYGHYTIGSIVLLLDHDKARQRISEQRGYVGPSIGASIMGRIKSISNAKLHIAWADGTQSQEFPSSVYCVNKDDIDSMPSEYSTYSTYSYSYSDTYSENSSSSAWETMSESNDSHANDGDEIEGDAGTYGDIYRHVENEHRGREEARWMQGRQEQERIAEQERNAQDPTPECREKFSFVTKMYRNVKQIFQSSSSNSRHVPSRRSSRSGSESDQLQRRPSLGLLIETDERPTTPGSNPLSNATTPRSCSQSFCDDSNAHVKETGAPGLANTIADEPKDSTEREVADQEVLQTWSSLLHLQSKKHPKFEVVSSVVSDHNYEGNTNDSAGVHNGEFQRHVFQQWKILRKGLPEGIWVRCYEDRMDLMRAVIVGSPDTPYHYALFFFDIYLPPEFPHEPPLFHYRSHGRRLNPNLYADGRLCLSILNTWEGRGRSERWDPAISSVLQVLVSIQGLVLIPKPYFNEAGYDKQRGTPQGEKNALLYNESAYLLCLKNIVNTIRNPPSGYEELVRDHYKRFGHLVTEAMTDYENGKPVGKHRSSRLEVDQQEASDGNNNDLHLEPSEGFKIMLTRVQASVNQAIASLQDE